jgi:dihydrofolate reductase
LNDTHALIEATPIVLSADALVSHEAPVSLSLIVAMAENRVVGCRGSMPWRLPADLRRFRTLTLGKPIVMGRNTFESIGRPLPGRDSIVVSRSGAILPPGVRHASTCDEAARIAGELARMRGVTEAFVIGGGEIYRAMLPNVLRIHMTLVHGMPDGDVLFPALDWSGWDEIHSEGPGTQPGDSHATTYTIYERAPPAVDRDAGVLVS